jgi:aminopeptidase N
MIKHIIRIALSLLLCLNLTTARSRDDYPRSAELDAIHYRISLELAEAGEQIRGEAGILLAIGGDGPGQATLDFVGLVVDRVEAGGRPARFTHADGRLKVALDEGYKSGDRVWLKVSYHGRPADGLYIKNNKFGDRTIFADNWPNRARHWFPSIDHPYDKATVEFLVTSPARFDVVANGDLVETTSRQDGAKLTHWRTTVPLPTYCMVVGAAEFSIIKAGSWGGIPVYYYLYPKDRERGIRDYGRAVQMLEFYTNLIGPFPYEKLALVQSSTRFGGMENSSAIFFDEKAFDGTGSLEPTVAHEIAHQWFGDSVTEADWHHLWLSEGFASYFENLFFERADGRDRFVRMMLADRERYIESSRASLSPIIDERVKDLFQLLNANNYQKGGWVLHMLRRVMGDERFFAGIRDYYRSHRDRNALTRDLQRVMEFHAGGRLDWFFKQWVYEAGHPVFEASWQWSEPVKQLRLRIVQKQPQPPFRTPLDVEIKLGNRSRREVVEVSEREHTFTFKLDSKPPNVILDPEEWVLKEMSIREEK